MPEHLIGLDAGTTGITAILYDRELRPERRVYAEIEQHFPRPGWVEHDPAEIRDTTVRLLKDLVEGDFSDVAAIGITNQRETVVSFDRETGEPIGRAVVWQCRRSADVCRRLKEGGREGLIREKTGLVLDPYFSGSKMFWLLENEDAIETAALRGTLGFATVDAWLVRCLTAAKRCATDPSNASRTMLYDVDALAWSPELLGVFGVKEEWLPEVVASAGDFGVTDAGVLGAEVPIRGVVGDHHNADRNRRRNG